jgi:hypothetical protein
MRSCYFYCFITMSILISKNNVFKGFAQSNDGPSIQILKKQMGARVREKN